MEIQSASREFLERLTGDRRGSPKFLPSLSSPSPHSYNHEPSTPSYQLLQSSDGLQTFQEYDGLPTSSMDRMEIINSDHWLVVDHYGKNGYAFSAILETKDAGTSWDTINSNVDLYLTNIEFQSPKVGCVLQCGPAPKITCYITKSVSYSYVQFSSRECFNGSRINNSGIFKCLFDLILPQ